MDGEATWMGWRYMEWVEGYKTEWKLFIEIVVHVLKWKFQNTLGCDLRMCHVTLPVEFKVDLSIFLMTFYSHSLWWMPYELLWQMWAPTTFQIPLWTLSHKCLVLLLFLKKHNMPMMRLVQMGRFFIDWFVAEKWMKISDLRNILAFISTNLWNVYETEIWQVISATLVLTKYLQFVVEYK